MWARVSEVYVALWLLLAPLVFQAQSVGIWTNALVCALLLLLFSLGSYHPRFQRAHLLELAVATWLLGFGFLRERPVPPIHQSHIVCALLLWMFAVVPSQAGRPPPAWCRPGGDA